MQRTRFAWVSHDILRRSKIGTKTAELWTILTVWTSFSNYELLQIKLPSDYWRWVNSTALPALYLAQWYNGKETSTYNEKFLNNLVSIRLGPPRLRMLRTSEGEQTLLSLSLSLYLFSSLSVSLFSLLSRSSHISMTPFILSSVLLFLLSHYLYILFSLCLFFLLSFSHAFLSHASYRYSLRLSPKLTNLSLYVTLFSSLSHTLSLFSLPLPLSISPEFNQWLSLSQVEPMVVSLSSWTNGLSFKFNQWFSLSSSTNGSLCQVQPMVLSQVQPMVLFLSLSLSLKFNQWFSLSNSTNGSLSQVQPMVLFLKFNQWFSQVQPMVLSLKFNQWFSLSLSSSTNVLSLKFNQWFSLSI